MRCLFGYLGTVSRSEMHGRDAFAKLAEDLEANRRLKVKMRRIGGHSRNRARHEYGLHDSRIR